MFDQRANISHEVADEVRCVFARPACFVAGGGVVALAGASQPPEAFFFDFSCACTQPS
jgi:hypothetical protein